MKKTIFLMTLVMVLAVLLSACNTAITPTGGQSSAAPYTINASGSGKVYITPDVAYVNFGVHTEADTVSEALRQNNAQSQAVAKSLSDGGIKTEDIQTSAFTVTPTQKYDENGNPTGKTVYVVENSVYVTVRDLGKLGQLLDSTVTSGANTVDGITFDVQDKTKALSEARHLAVADAMAQAKELADASGVKLGKLTSLNVYEDAGATPMYDVKTRQAAGVGGETSVSVSAGQLIVKMVANLSYEIVQ
jgi:uncharacterized protein